LIDLAPFSSYNRIGRILAIDRGVPHFNAPAVGPLANILISFTSPETRQIVLPDVENRMSF